MKKFARHKTHDEIVAQCMNPPQQGMLPAKPVPFDDSKWLSEGADTIVVGDIRDRSLGFVIYNTFNGKFYGTTPLHADFKGPPGLRFTSDDPGHDDEPWFNALLDFFYAEAVPEPKSTDVVEVGADLV